MKKKTYYIVGCIASILLGTLLHFIYDISNRLLIAGIFTPVNESVWEHLKLVLLPIVIFTIVTKIYRKENIFLNAFLAFVIACLVIVIIHYTSVLLGFDSTAVDILSYIIGMGIAFLTMYFLPYTSKNYTTLGISVLIISLLLFMLFTVYPPKLHIFLDPTTKTYGIFP